MSTNEMAKPLTRNVENHQHLACRWLLALMALAVGACDSATPPPPSDPAAGNGTMQPAPDQPATFPDATWSEAFDASGLGVLSAVWAQDATNVFFVGASGGNGAVHRFDGQQVETFDVPQVSALNAVFGLSADSVFTVGDGGSVLQYDGQQWVSRSSGTATDLRGIWGSGPTDLWIVGGAVTGGQPIILHFDSTAGDTSAFETFPTPSNDRSATGLFAIRGFGDTIFAVGSNGFIINFDSQNQRWVQSPTGPAANDDFLSLSATAANNFIAVGGRTTGRISVYDGRRWTTALLTTVEGLQSVFALAADQAVIGGAGGYVAAFNPRRGSIRVETSGVSEPIVGLWSVDDTTLYAASSAPGGFGPSAALQRVLAGGGTGTPPDGSQPPPDVPPDTTPPPNGTPPPDGASPGVVVEMGVLDGASFTAFADGDTLRVATVEGGGFSVAMAFSVTGFSTGGSALVFGGIVLSRDNSVIAPDFARGMVTLRDGGGNGEQLADLEILLNVDSARQIEGRETIVTFTLTDSNDSTITGSVARTLVLRAERNR